MKTNNFRNFSQECENQIYNKTDLFQQNRKKFLNEKLQQNSETLRTIVDQPYRQYKSRHKKNRQNFQSTININPILQPQQPQNYLNLSKQNKQVSIISYKSQPIDLKINQNNSHKSISMKHCHQKDRLQQRNLIQNDNKKTRKYLIRPINNFQQTAKNLQNQYYKVGGFQDIRKDNTLKQINFKDFNENTLSMKKSPCRHKSNKKQKQHLKSLEKISNRVSFCQAYIELSERKTNFLAKQIDYLLNKEFLRESKKYHKGKHQKISKSQSQRLIEPKFEPLKFTNDIQKSKRQKCNHKYRKQQHQNLEHYQQERNSKNRFHYRSNDNKSSRMKQLIYYHQDQKMRKQGQKDKLSKKQSFQNKYSSLKREELKQKKTNYLYDDNSSYLLPEENQYETNSKSATKNVKVNHFLPGQQIAPYINSELAPESYDYQNNQYQENSQQDKSQKNIYLIRQFEIHSTSNPKKSYLTDYRKSTNEKINRSKKEIKVEYLYDGPVDLIGQNKSEQIKFINRVKSQKKAQILIDSGKSSQTFKQKQYTFLRHQQTNKKDGSLSNYQIIDSNFNSPKNYDKNLSQSDSRQSQLIQEFNELVVASAKQETPQKKKMIQQQIYRTSKQLKEIDYKKVKSQLTSR